MRRAPEEHPQSRAPPACWAASPSAYILEVSTAARTLIQLLLLPKCYGPRFRTHSVFRHYPRHTAMMPGDTVGVQVLDWDRVVTTPQQFPHPTDFRPAPLISTLLCVETVKRLRHREPPSD